MKFPEGYAHLALGEVGSTLDEAQRRAPSLAGPTWITATRQTQARGRRGRRWVSPEGNFAGTLVLPDTGPPQEAALRSFVMSLALHDALMGLGVPPASLALKWPNDVLLQGGKLAGILLEGAGEALVIGIGVNLAEAPAPDMVEPGALPPVSLAGEAGLRVGPADFLAALTPAFAAREGEFRSHGFAPIRAEWLARAARLGEEITARLPREEITGRFETVDEEGRIVLSTPETRHEIAAGDIFF